jgi:ATP-dependent protease ClpP protease subunit
MKEFELTQARMLAHYQACTGLSADQIRISLLPPQDVWLSAQDALALQVCDFVAELAR